jgi:hypothetical protein
LPDGSCVQCLDNIDCGAAQPICDPDGFDCRAGCTSNAQCTGDTPICNTTASSCVQCLGNSDCAPQPGKFCSGGGRCVECLSNSDCPQAKPTCHAGACVQCFRPKDCPKSQGCNSGVCQ